MKLATRYLIIGASIINIAGIAYGNNAGRAMSISSTLMSLGAAMYLETKDGSGSGVEERKGRGEISSSSGVAGSVRKATPIKKAGNNKVVVARQVSPAGEGVNVAPGPIDNNPENDQF